MMMDEKKSLLIPKIENGIVIDHIPAGLGAQLLALIQSLPEIKETSISLGINYKSNKLGFKDLIKLQIDDLPDRMLRQISIVSPGVSIKRITDYMVDKKYILQMPKTIQNLVKCSNPNCITNFERHLATRFTTINNRDKPKVKCGHCERVFQLNELERII